MDGEASYERDLDNFKATELTLGLPGTEPTPSRGSKRALDETSDACQPRRSSLETGSVDNGGADAGPAAKVQVVGWPPIRSYRRNSFQLAKKTEAEAAGIYVKVSMDGAPYLRKIDLKVYEGYKNLREALEDMFKCFSLGDCGSEYAVTYEDKDGDWMLVGDVPWNMFVSSCKRLRIMKGSEARGLDSSS